MERHWSGVQEWLGELFVERGVDRISAEELTVPPGMDELFSLLRLQAPHESPTGTRSSSTARPPARRCGCCRSPTSRAGGSRRCSRSSARSWPPPGRSRARCSTSRCPAQAVFADIQRLSQNLIAMNEILRDRERSTIRLVMNPDKMVIGEAMRTFTYLNLYGYLTDAVIVNRVFPVGRRRLLRGVAAACRRSTSSSSTRPSRRCRCCARPTSTRR